jgi:hypothetical protein
MYIYILHDGSLSSSKSLEVFASMAMRVADKFFYT